MALNSTWKNVLDLAGAQLEEARPLIPMYIHLIVSALFPIYVGAFASLSRPSSAAKQSKTALEGLTEDQDDDEEEDEETVQHMEGLQPSDAIVFPLMAGSVLAGLYFLIKRYGAEIINLVLGCYFSFVGVYSVGSLLNDSLTIWINVVFPSYYIDQGKLWRIVSTQRHATTVGSTANNQITRPSPLPGAFGRLPLPRACLSLAWSIREWSKQRYNLKGFLKGVFDFKITLRKHSALAAILGVAAVGYSVFVTKPWWLTNLQGFGVCYGALQLMSPTTFATGTLILSGLFVYDIWAVFFTPLMITVAKNLDVPIKLVFPRPDEPDQGARSYSMLGLGDIVLPGIMIALALRFDLHNFYLKKQKYVTKDKSGSEDSTKEAAVEKASYVPVTGRWGDKLWTSGSYKARLPDFLSLGFPKPYFTASMVGYVVGMVATLVAMSLMRHAQPALLYLVPGVLISLWGSALVRGELKLMWNYTEAITGEPLDDGEKTMTTTDQSHSEESSLASTVSAIFDPSKWKDYFAGKQDGKISANAKSANIDKSDKVEQTPEKEATDANAIDSDVVFTLSVKLWRANKNQASPRMSIQSPDSKPLADTTAHT